MADYFTQFSCVLGVGSVEHAQRAIEIYDRLASDLEDDDGVCPGFNLDVDANDAPGTLWIHSDGDGDPEHVSRFALLCAEAFNLSGRWGFAWSHTCSRPRLDEFGGGALVLDLGERVEVEWIDCATWVSERTKSDTTPSEVVEAVP